MGICRWNFVFQSQFKSVALKRGWVPVTASETITYKKSIKAFSRVQVVTRLLFWDDERFYLEQKFMIKGSIHAQAYLEGLIRSPKGHLKPPEVFKELGVQGQSPLPPESLRKWILSKASP